MSSVDDVAREIASDLFKSCGRVPKADRLVLWDDTLKREIAGWGELAAVERIAAILTWHFGEQDSYAPPPNGDSKLLDALKMAMNQWRGYYGDQHQDDIERAKHGEADLYRYCESAVREQDSLRPRLVILEATEDGWNAIEDLYSGYTPHDAVLWAYEDSICAIAGIVGDAGSISDQYPLNQ